MRQMFLKMKEDDHKRYMERREEDRLTKERREEEERAREQRREQRQQQLLLQLRESQPAVPQNVTVTQTKLPLMKQMDELEPFLIQLEIALKSGGNITYSHNSW